MISNKQVFHQLFGSLFGGSYELVQDRKTVESNVDYEKMFQRMYNECGIDIKTCMSQAEEETNYPSINKAN
jgi:hypothetical protein